MLPRQRWPKPGHAISTMLALMIAVATFPLNTPTAARSLECLMRVRLFRAEVPLDGKAGATDGVAVPPPGMDDCRIWRARRGEPARSPRLAA